MAEQSGYKDWNSPQHFESKVRVWTEQFTKENKNRKRRATQRPIEWVIKTWEKVLKHS